jgi:hypothetical protein
MTCDTAKCFVRSLIAWLSAAAAGKVQVELTTVTRRTTSFRYRPIAYCHGKAATVGESSPAISYEMNSHLFPMPECHMPTDIGNDSYLG